MDASPKNPFFSDKCGGRTFLDSLSNAQELKILDIGLNTSSAFIQLDNGANSLKPTLNKGIIQEREIPEFEDVQNKFGYTLLYHRKSATEIISKLNQIKDIDGFVLNSANVYKSSPGIFSMDVTFKCNIKIDGRYGIEEAYTYQHLLWPRKRKHILIECDKDQCDSTLPNLQRIVGDILGSNILEKVVTDLGHIVEVGKGNSPTGDDCRIPFSLREDNTVWLDEKSQLLNAEDLLFFLGYTFDEIFEILNKSYPSIPKTQILIQDQTSTINNLFKCLENDKEFTTWECVTLSKMYDVRYRSSPITQDQSVPLVFSLYSNTICLKHILSVLNALEPNVYEIDRIRNYSTVLYACVEIRAFVDKDVLDLAKLQKDFYDKSFDLGCDIWVQEDNIYRRHKRIASFDMDSTLVYEECIDIMAEIANVSEVVSEITEQAMLGFLDFEAALRERVSVLKGQSYDTLINETCNRIHYSPGAKVLCKALDKLGFETMLISGGFIPIVNKVRKDLSIRHGYGNCLDVDPKTGALTGLLGEGKAIIDAMAKKYHVEELCKDQGISRHQCIAVGDGSNDKHMLSSASLDVAYRAKPILQKSAHFHMNHVDNLRCIASSLGISSSELEDLILEKP